MPFITLPFRSIVFSQLEKGRNAVYFEQISKFSVVWCSGQIYTLRTLWDIDGYRGLDLNQNRPISSLETSFMLIVALNATHMIEKGGWRTLEC
jgi:hypothetical protein